MLILKHVAYSIYLQTEGDPRKALYARAASGEMFLWWTLPYIGYCGSISVMLDSQAINNYGIGSMFQYDRSICQEINTFTRPVYNALNRR